MPVSALKATLPQIGCEPLSVSLLKLGDLPKKSDRHLQFFKEAWLWPEEYGLDLDLVVCDVPGLFDARWSQQGPEQQSAIQPGFSLVNFEKKEKETITILWNLQFDIFWNWNGKLKSWLLKFDAKKVWWLFAKSKKDNSQKKCPQLCISIYGLYSYFSINLYRRNRSYHDWGQHVVRMLLFFQLNDMKSGKIR